MIAALVHDDGQTVEVVKFCKACRGYGSIQGRRGNCRRCSGSGSEPTPTVSSIVCPCGDGALTVTGYPGDGARTSTVLCPACEGTFYVSHFEGSRARLLSEGAA